MLNMRALSETGHSINRGIDMKGSPCRNFVVMILCMVVFMSSCTGRKSSVDAELKSIDRQANAEMSTLDKAGLDSLGNLLLRRAKAKNDLRMQGRAHLYLSAFMPSVSDSLKKAKQHHLDLAENIAVRIHDDTLLCYVYNQRGVWELGSMSPQTSQYWFQKSMAQAAKIGSRTLSIPAEVNLSEACRLSGDTLGIVYDQELLRYAKERKESLLQFTTAMHCANYYAISAGDTAVIRPFIDAMRPMEADFPGIIEMTYARFYFHHGNFREAEKLIKKASPENYNDKMLLYARILTSLGKFDESEMWLDRIGENASLATFNDNLTIKKLRAVNSRGLGNSDKAYQRMMEYDVYRDSIDRALAADRMKRAKIEYEVNIKDMKISNQRAHIRNLKFVILGIVSVFLTGIVFYYIWQRRRNKFYKDIVRQNRSFIERQDLLMEEISRRDSHIESLRSIGMPKERPNMVSQDHADEIFRKIQELTLKSEIWRDVTVTRDNFADLCGCNRTYMSDVIKKKTGMGYSQYMNYCRIKEAVRVLSDPADSTSLKELSKQLGFLTIQTFYSVFKKEIGISPAAFRKTAKGEQTADS